MSHHAQCPCATCALVHPSLHWLAVNATAVVLKAADGVYPFEELEKRAINEFARELEKEMRAKLRELTRSMNPPSQFTEAQVRRIISQLRDFRDSIAPAIVPGATVYAQLVADAGAEAGLGQLPDGSYDFTQTRGRYSEQVAAAAKRSAERMAQSVAQTSADRIARVIRAGVEENLTGREVATLITETTGMSIDRATAIARTESARAFVDGQLEAWKATGVVAGKRWLVSPFACAFCEAAGERFGAKTIPLDEPFFALGEVLTVGSKSMTLDFDTTNGPPLHPNCRCTVIPELTEEVQ